MDDPSQWRERQSQALKRREREDWRRGEGVGGLKFRCLPIGDERRGTVPPFPSFPSPLL